LNVKCQSSNVKNNQGGSSNDKAQMSNNNQISRLKLQT
jgi:hypothetical protein